MRILRVGCRDFGVVMLFWWGCFLERIGHHRSGRYVPQLAVRSASILPQSFPEASGQNRVWLRYRFATAAQR